MVPVSWRLADSLVPLLAEHIRKYRPGEVTVPWKTPDGEPVTRTLILATPAGGALNGPASIRRAGTRRW
jgi:hypothetical protein